jgi:hypothetical protein
MATLARIDTITKITVRLRWGEFEEREFHALPSFMLFIQEKLPALQQGVLGAKETPQQQLDTVLRKWITGRPMQQGRMFSALRPARDHVWEMKTVDLRIFGWLYRPKVFVAAFAGFTDDYKEQNGNRPKETYDAARRRVVWIRDRIDLDPPPFATGAYDALV